MSKLKWMLVSMPDENGDIVFELQGNDGGQVSFKVRGYSATAVASAIIDGEYEYNLEVDDAGPIH